MAVDQGDMIIVFFQNSRKFLLDAETAPPVVQQQPLCLFSFLYLAFEQRLEMADHFAFVLGGLRRGEAVAGDCAA